MFANIYDDSQLVNEPTTEPNNLALVVTNHTDSFRRVETIPVFVDIGIVYTEVIPRKYTRKLFIVLYRRANEKEDLNNLHIDILPK